ncbi:MAG: hypothetical protein QXF26_04450 [Candidatus Bathyarchaeia archaeon]
MGYVYTPKDLLKGRRHLLEEGLGDITPTMREEVRRILQDWQGEDSEKKLIDLLGQERTVKLKRILEN